LDKSNYTGADFIADFIADQCCGTAFLVTGGACAYIVDAIGRNPKSNYVCFQHEQAAAMAADAVWRTTGKIGVTIATSGPGATNLITGIVCSWFDSIPTIHITGQVNQAESCEVIGANVRQAGFQETDIVSMVKSVTKFAKKVESIDELVEILPKILKIATSGRMGPVLIDVPMNIQKMAVKQNMSKKFITGGQNNNDFALEIDIADIVNNSKRPVVLIGAGAALSGSARVIQFWCEENNIPYVSSWGSLTYLERAAKLYFGSIGVYGSSKANWLVQASDCLIVFGSRLDNRQRTGEPQGFAPFAKIYVFDIDIEELNKFKKFNNYHTYLFDLKYINKLLGQTSINNQWSTYSLQITSDIKEEFESSVSNNEFNPYKAIRILQSKFESESIIVSDTGANLCWVFQSYLPDTSFLFTAGGNSPMGYSLPAAIGAKLVNSSKRVYCFIGDGGLQMNLQELQTIQAYNLPITIIILNNFGYGIIKQFQDSNLEKRYYASGDGYTTPNFGAIAKAYNISYSAIQSEYELHELQIPNGVSIIELQFSVNSLIVPKTESNHFIHDQFPYINKDSISKLPYKYPKYPSELLSIQD